MESAPSKNYVFIDTKANMWFAIKGDRRCFRFGLASLMCEIRSVEEIRQAYKATKAKYGKTTELNNLHFEIDPYTVNTAISQIVNGYKSGKFLDKPLDF